jgi:hypothetical protein
MARLLRRMATLAACLALVAFVALTVASALGAQTPSPLQTLLGAVKDDTRATRAAVTSRRFGLREIKREVRKLEARSNRLEVTAEVNEAACASVPVQCETARLDTPSRQHRQQTTIPSPSRSS